MKYSTLELIRSAPEKKPSDKGFLKRYEEYFGTLPEIIQDFPWYENYVGQFKLPEYIEFKTPLHIRQGTFDWILFFELVSASFSTELDIEFSLGIFEAYIEVTQGETFVRKKFNDIVELQAVIIFGILIKEQSELEILRRVSKVERSKIDNYRKVQRQQFKNLVDKATKHKATYELLQKMNLTDLSEDQSSLDTDFKENGKK